MSNKYDFEICWLKKDTKKNLKIMKAQRDEKTFSSLIDNLMDNKTNNEITNKKKKPLFPKW